MKETTNINDCGRAEELIAYFYGEANSAERASFGTHLARCGACRDELADFGQVRAALGEWRAEILNPAPLLSSARPVAPHARREHERVALPRRSALSALREFFTLSPLWLRAGTVAAALVVCALAALAIANAELRWDSSGGLAFSTGLNHKTKSAPTSQVDAPAVKLYTQAEMSRLAAERDAAVRELEDTRAQLDDSREANLLAASETLEPAPVSNAVSDANNSRRERRTTPAPGTRPKQFTDERDEEDLPRLYDLLTEAN